MRNLISELVKKNLKANKKKLLVFLASIVLTTSMLSSVFTIWMSMSKSEEISNRRMVGTSAHVTYQRLTKEQTETIMVHPLIQEYGVSVLLGTCVNQELDQVKTELVYSDLNYAKYSFAEPTVGRMPKNENEIAMDSVVLEALGIPAELGSTVTFQYKEDMKQDEIKEAAFTLCGTWEGDFFAASHPVILSKTFVEKKLQAVDQKKLVATGKWSGLADLAIKLPNTKNLEENSQQILLDSGLEKDEITARINWSYAAGNIETEDLIQKIGVILLIVLTGYFIIYNIFYLLLARDIHFYGKLKIIGASNKQIKQLVINQGRWLSIIGIPIGLLFGYGVAAVILPVSLSYLGENRVLSFHPAIFLLSAMLAFVTVMISVRKAASVVKKLTPLESIRYISPSFSSAKPRRYKRKEKKLWEMAYSNLNKRKKNTIFVVASLSLGLILFLCMGTISRSFDADKWVRDYIVSDFYLADRSESSVMHPYNLENQTITEDLLNELESQEGIRQIQNQYFTETSFTISKQQQERLIKYYDRDDRAPYKYMSRMPEWLKAYKIMRKKAELAVKMYGADQWILEQGEVFQGKIDWEKFNTGKYAVAVNLRDNKDKVFAIGESITVDGETYEIMAALELPRSMRSNDSQNTIFSYEFLIHTKQFQKIYQNAPIYHSYIEVENEFQNEIENSLKSYQNEIDANLVYTSKESYLTSFQKEIDAQTVMGKMIAVMIAVIGVANYMNTMVTSYESQRKDVARMQCIGMGKKQVFFMFICESLILMGLTLAVTFIVGSVCSLFGIRPYLAGDGIHTYQFTLIPLIQVMPVLLLISIVLPWVNFYSMEQKTLIERLAKTE